MAQITYADKVQGQTSAFPTNQKWVFGDANEVKSVVNANDALRATNTANIATNTSDIADLQGRINVLVNITANYNLPASGSTNAPYRLINRSGSDWVITADGSDTIEGESTQTIYDGETFDLLLNGTDWTV